MLPGSVQGRQSRQLLFRLRNASKPTPDLFSCIVDVAFSRQKMPVRAGKTGCLNRLIEREAWFEAALELVALAHPAWTPRRLVYDDGEWICSLSSMPSLPLFLDPMAEFTHAHPTLAILGALLELSAGRPSGGIHSTQAAAHIRNVEPHCVRSYPLD